MWRVCSGCPFSLTRPRSAIRAEYKANNNEICLLFICMDKHTHTHLTGVKREKSGVFAPEASVPHCLYIMLLFRKMEKNIFLLRVCVCVRLRPTNIQATHLDRRTDTHIRAKRESLNESL